MHYFKQSERELLTLETQEQYVKTCLEQIESNESHTDSPHQMLERLETIHTVCILTMTNELYYRTNRRKCESQYRLYCRIRDVFIVCESQVPRRILDVIDSADMRIGLFERCHELWRVCHERCIRSYIEQRDRLLDHICDYVEFE